MKPEQSIIEFADSLRFNDLSKEVVSAVKRMTMNTLAAMVAGSGSKGVLRLTRMVDVWAGRPESAIFLHQSKVPAVEAVFVNAAMARAMDFDDFHIQTGIHASATLIPVALAVSETIGTIDGKTFITAIALGAEIICRMRTVPDHCIGISGWTGEIFGAFGSALAAGKMFDLDAYSLSHALGLSYAQACGNSQAIYDGTDATFLQQGIMARGGLLAVLMARAGLTGANNFLTGLAGFYPVYYRGMDYDIDRLTQGLGDSYVFLNIATKMYPSCGFTMAPIENVIGLMKDNRLCPEGIETIDVLVNKKMHATVCTPVARKYHPQVPADALFSMPYVIATGVLTGDVVLADFTPDAIDETDRLEWMEKIHIVEDEAIERKAVEANMALGTHGICIRCKDGRVFEREMSHSAGFPQNPLTLDQCALKAKKVAGAAIRPISENTIDTMQQIIENLECLDTLKPLTDLMD
jgi:2-methylcitrate dehydratase PrpD